MKDRTEQIKDEWLVLRSQDGDAQAFNQLILRWQDRLWRHARRLIRDDTEAWDVLQEAWVGIIRNLRRLDDPRAFSQWAYRIVTFKCVDHVRHRKRQRQLNKELPNQVAEQSGKYEEIEILRLALQDLSVDQIAVLSLFYKEELRIEQIADVLKIPEGTVKSRLHNARNNLKKRMERRQK